MLWVKESDPIELREGSTEEDLQAVIRAVYKQVLGNQHIMDWQRLSSAEAMLRNGDISVRGFVSMVAKSELYRSLFFAPCSQYRFIELNYKHFLGRAPQDQSEIAAHVETYNSSGYDAEIDSYIISEEYECNFSENIVPYPRSNSTQVGIANVGFNRTFSLMRGYATSDSGNEAQLITDIAANLPTKITATPAGSGTYSNTGKRYRIAVAAKNAYARLNKLSKLEYEVNYDQLLPEVQQIQKMGGKIASITEVV